MKLNRPRPLALFLFLACFGTTLALGTWQVARLQWKTDLIASIAQAQKNAPLSEIPSDTEALEKIAFYPITLHGIWQEDEFHITPRFFKSKLGYFVVSPFLLEDGRTVFVNRGWVPTEKKELAKRPETKVSGKATIHGMIRLGDERNILTPQSDPVKNLWFGRDVAQMAATIQSENVVPAMVDLVGSQDAKSLPVPSDGTIRLTNDHLSYIITWYGIAMGILAIFILSLRDKKQKELRNYTYLKK